MRIFPRIVLYYICVNFKDYIKNNGLYYFSVILLIFLPCCLKKNSLKIIGISQWVSNPEYDRNIAGFKDKLAEYGFIENKNLKYIIKIAEADKTKQREIIKSFKDNKVDLIYSLTTPGTLIAKEIIKDIPIVFSIVTYPAKAGVIKSIENSGCNA
ncbi:MAG: ABC transporter substrate binding protein, partial [bacterium]